MGLIYRRDKASNSYRICVNHFLLLFSRKFTCLFSLLFLPQMSDHAIRAAAEAPVAALALGAEKREALLALGLHRPPSGGPG